MRIKHILLVLFALILWCGSLIPSTTQAAPIDKEKMTLLEAIEKISKQYDVYFTFDMTLVSKVKVDYKRNLYSSAEEALMRVLAGTGLKYKFFDHRFVIIYKDDAKGLESLKQMSKHLSGLIREGENKLDPVGRRETLNISPMRDQPVFKMITPIAFSVEGTVVNNEGEALVGVTVQVKGSAKGTTTDANGHFVLNDIEANATLVISYVGFETQAVRVEGRATLKITMVTADQSLEQVVVVGYGTQQRKDLTGSIETIKMDQIQAAPATNFMQMLRGYAPGLNVTGGGSTAGDQPSFSIRGQSSLSASSAPLIVVDGIIYQGSISDINPLDIEQVDVLKDASAAAVYGSRSANGVILITTKKGKTIKPLIGLNASVGFKDFSNNPVRPMNGNEYAVRLVDYDWEGKLYNWYSKMPTNENDKGGRPIRPNVDDKNVVAVYLIGADEVDNFLNGNEINWLDEVTRTAPTQHYDLSVSGKSDRTNYYFSGSYMNEKGIMVNDQFKKYNLTTNVESKVFDWLTIGLNLAYSNRNKPGLPTTLNYAMSATPLGNLRDADGNYPIWYNGDFLMRHPLRNTLVDQSNVSENFFKTITGKFDVPWVKGLTYNFNYSNNVASANVRSFIPATIYEGIDPIGQATITNSKATSWIINNIISFSRRFGTNHKIDAVALYSAEKRYGDGSSAVNTHFQSELLGYNNISFGNQPVVSSNAWQESSISYLGRINYGFKDRYLLTGTFRRDGFSGFGVDNKYADFPSIALGWNLSEENFMRDTKAWLDFLKIRISYGVNGNQGIGRYSSLSRMTQNLSVFGSSTAIGLIPTQLGNSGLGWETTRSLNLGFDFRIIGSRLSGAFDFYNSRTSDVLVLRSLPTATGYNSVWTNIGGLKNKGFEFEVSSINLDGELRWETRFMFSLDRDRITDLYGDGRDDIGNSWFIGEPISAIYDYVRTGGVWTEEEFFKGAVINGFYPGQFRLEDLNHDGAISASNDRAVIGYAAPNYRFSIGNTITYKGFALYFMVNSIQGGNGYYKQNLRALLEPIPDFNYAQRENQPAIRKYWTPDNGVTNAPAIVNQPLVLSGNYQDRSFIRLQDLTFSYNFQSNLLNKLNANSLQVYFSGRNLHVWTKWEGYDPEIGGSTLPLMRSYDVGVKLTFN